MTKITAQLLRDLRNEIDAALETVGYAHGLSLKMGNGSYDRSGLFGSLKLEIGLLDTKSGKVTDKRMVSLERYYPQYVNVRITHNPRMTTRVIGYHTTGRGKPFVLLDESTGKEYTCSESYIKTYAAATGQDQSPTKDKLPVATLADMPKLMLNGKVKKTGIEKIVAALDDSYALGEDMCTRLEQLDNQARLSVSQLCTATDEMWAALEEFDFATLKSWFTAKGYRTLDWLREDPTADNYRFALIHYQIVDKICELALGLDQKRPRRAV